MTLVISSSRTGCPSGDSEERGAVLLMFVAALLVLIAAASMALNLASDQDRGQNLQNAADAAALAAVTEWSTTLDQASARQAVAEILAKTGITQGDGFSWQVEFPSATEATVAIEDSSPHLFLSGALGTNDGIGRTATAEFTPCGPTCGAELAIPRPFQSINYGGRGDGYRPVLVGDKVYAARHHDRTMTCIDRRTNDLCWSTDSRDLFSDSDLFTMNVTHMTLVGTRLFYLGFDDSWSQRWTNYPRNTGALYIGCWETLTDTRCGDTPVAAGQRHGMLAANEDGLFVFTNHRNVYCINPDTLSACSGYSGGRPMAAASLSWNNKDTAMRNSTFREYNRKVYTTIARKGSHYLQCWDTKRKMACTGFGTFEVNDNSAIGGSDVGGDIWVEGRLFFSRSSDGTPNAICSSGKNQVECFDLNTGARRSRIEGPLNTFAGTWAHIHAGTPSAGQHTYHEQSNRTFFLGQTDDNRTYCWDWAGGDCGRVHHTDGLGEPRPYGYFATPECLFGLGHNKIFWTLKPDMSGGCDQGAAELPISPCTCAGEPIWPDVTLENVEGVEIYSVRIVDGQGDQLFPEVSGEWLNLKPGNSIDLAEVLGDEFATVTLQIVVTAALGKDPWADGNFPTLTLEAPPFRPFLTD